MSEKELTSKVFRIIHEILPLIAGILEKHKDKIDRQIVFNVVLNLSIHLVRSNVNAMRETKSSEEFINYTIDKFIEEITSLKRIDNA